MTRRAAMAGGLALALSAGLPRAGAAGQARVVALDYGAATTLLALGVTPVGVADLADWDIWVVEPEMPEGVADVGDDLAVNLEAVASLKPDIILSTPYLQAGHAALQKIAPVHVFSIYAPDGLPLDRSIDATRAIGRLVGRERDAERYLDAMETAFAACRARVAALNPGALALVNLMDARHARIFGRQSLYQDVLDRLGIDNAWNAPTNPWGFQTIAIEELGRLDPDRTRLIAFEPVPPDAWPTLNRSPLWNALPFVAAGRVSTLPGVLMFGMVPSALRFAELVTAHLEEVTA